jgi:adenine/guanine phosphoribosyltransferase-like PRPP-binding protein
MKKKPSKKKPNGIRHRIETEYLGRVYGKNFLKLVPKAVSTLKAFRKKHPFDAIAFTGSSGAALAFPLSYFLKVPLIHVRKKDKNHYGGSIEGTISSRKYIIVDDFIESGTTVYKIINTIKKEYSHPAEIVGICLYDSERRWSDFDGVPVVNIPKR